MYKKYLSLFNNTFFLKILLLVTGILLYGRVIYYQFAADDFYQIISNTSIHAFKNIPFLFSHGTFNPQYAQTITVLQFRPLMSLLFALCFAIWGSWAGGYHVVSLLLHLSNVILLFYFFSYLFISNNLKNAKVVSFVLSLIFLVHPVNTEVVANISSVMELLCLFFVLLSFLILFSKKRTIIHNILIGVCLLGAILSKETGFLSILFVVIYCFFYKKSYLKTFFILLVPILSAYIYLRFFLAKIALLGYVSPIAHATIWERILTIPYILFSYLKLFFFPVGLWRIHNVVVSNITFTYTILPSFLVLLLIIFMLYFNKKYSSNLLTFFTLWIVISFLPLLNLFPLDFTFANRWMYQPLVGILGFLGIIGIDSVQKFALRKGIIIVIILLLSTLSFRYLQIWENNTTYLGNEVAHNREDCDVINTYSNVLLKVGQEDKAFNLLKTCTSTRLWYVNLNLGDMYKERGDYKNAFISYSQALLYKNSPIIYIKLADVLVENKEKDHAIEILLEASEKYPSDTTILYRLGLLYYQLGKVKESQYFLRKTYYLGYTSEVLKVWQIYFPNQNFNMQK